MKHLAAVFLLAILVGCSDNRNRSIELSNKSAESSLKGNYKLAVQQAEEAIRLDDRNHLAYNNLGVAKKQLKYPFKEVEANYLKALELAPKDSNVLISLMILYFANDKYEKVVKHAEPYLQLFKPDTAPLLNIIGESYRVNKQPAKGLVFLSRAMELDSTDWGIIMNLAEAHMDLKNYGKALQYLNKARKVNPNYPGIYNEISISHYALGNLDSALLYVNKALSFEKDTVYMINKGTYLIKMDSINAGCALFKKVESMGRTIEKIYGLESEPAKLKSQYCK